MTRKLPWTVITRAGRLLDMLYRPDELALELSIPSRTVREWIQYGMPYERDPRGHLWVNGVQFSHWVEQIRKQWPRIPLAEDEGFCLHCKRRVKLTQAARSERANGLLLTSACPHCGATVNRGVKRDPPR